MRALMPTLLILLVTSCGDCRDTRAAVRFCEADSDCASTETCEAGQCRAPGTSWVEPNDPPTDGSQNNAEGSSDAGGDADTSDDEDRWDPSDRLPPGTAPVQPAPDTDDECDVPFTASCNEGLGFCVGAHCVDDCYQFTECGRGEVCRGDRKDGFRCVERTECGPGGSGMVTDTTCQQDWFDCSGNTYQMFCKALGPTDIPNFVENTPVLCTCYHNGVPGNRFEWVGMPCAGLFHVEIFYNEMCDWTLPSGGRD